MLKKSVILILTAAILLTFNAVTVKAGEPLGLNVTFESQVYDGGVRLRSLIKNDRALVRLRDIAEEIFADISWDKETGKVHIKGINGKTLKFIHIELTPGEKYAYINGKKVKLDTPILIKDGVTYVPVRFMANAFGLDMWKREGKTINQLCLTSYIYEEKIGDYHFLLDKKRKQLFYFIKDSNPKIQKIADLKDFEFHNFTSFDTCEKTPQGNILLTIQSFDEPTYIGAPYSDKQSNYYIYMNLKNGIIHQCNANYVPRPMQADEKNTKYCGEQVVLVDGKNIFLIDDETGKINKKININKLLEKDTDDEKYLVLNMDENHILLRNESKGILIVVDLKNDKIVELYKIMLNEDMQREIEAENLGDNLEFIKQEDNVLYIKDRNKSEAYFFSQ